jgi:hypothetical protein
LESALSSTSKPTHLNAIHKFHYTDANVCIFQITGQHTGRVVFIPRILLLTNDNGRMPFTLQRLQYPLSLAFAMTAHKSISHTVNRVGLYLTTPVFAHGLLYLSLSRTGQGNSVRVCVRHAPEQGQGVSTLDGHTYTRNVVHRRVLNSIRMDRNASSVAQTSPVRPVASVPPHDQEDEKYDPEYDDDLDDVTHNNPYEHLDQHVWTEQSNNNSSQMDIEADLSTCLICHEPVDILEEVSHVFRTCSCSVPIRLHRQCAMQRPRRRTLLTCPECGTNIRLEVHRNERQAYSGPHFRTPAPLTAAPVTASLGSHVAATVIPTRFRGTRYEETASWLCVPLIRAVLNMDAASNANIIYHTQTLLPTSVWRILLNAFRIQFEVRGIDAQSVPVDADGYIHSEEQERLLLHDNAQGPDLIPNAHALLNSIAEFARVHHEYSDAEFPLQLERQLREFGFDL